MERIENQNNLEQLQQQKSEYKLIGYIKPERGHTIFEYNLLTKEINPVEVVYEESITFDKAIVKDFSKKGRVNKKDNCIYVSALNKKNALKKIKKVTNTDFR